MTNESGSGKTVLITGAGGGIGRVSCMEFAMAGWRVAASDCNAEACHEIVTEIGALGFEIRAYQTDIGDSQQVQKLMADIKTDFGRLDAAFNNAGISAFRVPLAEVQEADWDRVLRTNLTGTFLCMKYEIQAMLAQGWGGSIVNNSSIFGKGGGRSSTYTATKHGVAGLTKAGAIAYAELGIRINAVCPGLIDAGMGIKALCNISEPKVLIQASGPINRIGTALEVVKAVLWLCSDDASFVHGHLMAIDGGYGAR